MKNKHFNLTSGIVLILIPLVFSFTGCKDDYETYYEGYGLVSKSGDEKFTVKLDDGYLLYPREYYFNPEKLNDSTRLRIRFNILEEFICPDCLCRHNSDQIHSSVRRNDFGQCRKRSGKDRQFLVRSWIPEL